MTLNCQQCHNNAEQQTIVTLSVITDSYCRQRVHSVNCSNWLLPLCGSQRLFQNVQKNCPRHLLRLLFTCSLFSFFRRFLFSRWFKQKTFPQAKRSQGATLGEFPKSASHSYVSLMSQISLYNITYRYVIVSNIGVKRLLPKHNKCPLCSNRCTIQATSLFAIFLFLGIRCFKLWTENLLLLIAQH